MRWLPELRPRPRWGSLQLSPGLLAGFVGVKEKGNGEKREEQGKGNTPPRLEKNQHLC